jgi:hypothetical protein
MTREHTPGPWEWWTSCSWKRLTSKDSKGEWLRQGNVLCPSIASDGHPVLDVSEADMALIAAAPDMLEALKALRDACMGMVPDCAGQVDAAIAKAEGRSLPLHEGSGE